MSLYTPGKIIYFDPFYFKNGASAKSKYFLVLKVIDNITILASLPSSQHHLPVNQEIYHGCIEDAASCINCYVFKKGQVITSCGFSFDLDTFLYGQWLDEYNLDNLNDKYQVEGIEYSVVGELLNNELQNVIDCFVRSAVVKRKFKRWLTEY